MAAGLAVAPGIPGHAAEYASTVTRASKGQGRLSGALTSAAYRCQDSVCCSLGHPTPTVCTCLHALPEVQVQAAMPAL